MQHNLLYFYLEYDTLMVISEKMYLIISYVNINSVHHDNFVIYALK